MNPWRITSWVCAVVVVGSVLACLWMASRRTTGLVAVTVRALDPMAEPVDVVVPVVKQHEALPDYELTLIHTDGRHDYLGVKPDESAAKGLTWHLSEPVSVREIATLRLREKDRVVSDEIAEVEVTPDPVEAHGYRFEFQFERSADIGIQAFFATPIGMAITGAFFVGVLLLVLSRLA